MLHEIIRDDIQLREIYGAFQARHNRAYDFFGDRARWQMQIDAHQEQKEVRQQEKNNFYAKAAVRATYNRVSELAGTDPVKARETALYLLDSELALDILTADEVEYLDDTLNFLEEDPRVCDKAIAGLMGISGNESISGNELPNVTMEILTEAEGKALQKPGVSYIARAIMNGGHFTDEEGKAYSLAKDLCKKTGDCVYSAIDGVLGWGNTQAKEKVRQEELIEQGVLKQEGSVVDEECWFNGN